jgi:hypothetical protein
MPYKRDVLDFGGHFLSPGWDSFFKRGGFSTATGDFTHNQVNEVYYGNYLAGRLRRLRQFDGLKIS